MAFLHDLKTLTEAVGEPIHRALHDAQSPLAVAKMNAQHLGRIATQMPLDDTQRNALQTSTAAIYQAIQQTQDGLKLLGTLFQIPQMRPTEDTFLFREICETTLQSYPYKRRQDAQKIQCVFTPEYATLNVLGHKMYTSNALQLMIKHALRAPITQTWQWSFAKDAVHLCGTHFILEDNNIETQLEWQYIKNVFALNHWEWLSLQHDQCSFKIRIP